MARVHILMKPRRQAQPMTMKGGERSAPWRHVRRAAKAQQKLTLEGGEKEHTLASCKLDWIITRKCEQNEEDSEVVYLQVVNVRRSRGREKEPQWWGSGTLNPRNSTGNRGFEIQKEDFRRDETVCSGTASIKRFRESRGILPRKVQYGPKTNTETVTASQVQLP